MLIVRKGDLENEIWRTCFKYTTEEDQDVMVTHCTRQMAGVPSLSGNFPVFHSELQLGSFRSSISGFIECQ